jgi:acyl carrier protein
MSSKEELVLRVREIVADVVDLDLEPDDDILRTGRLDSLGLIELIAAIEQVLGTPVSLTDFDIEDFRTIRSIVALVSSPASVHDGLPTPATAASSPPRSPDGEPLAPASEQDLEAQSRAV